MMKLLLVLAFCIAATLACQDRVSICSRYNKARYCNHSYLKQNCQKYCGHCSTDSCIDSMTACSRIPAHYCNYSYYKNKCQKRCGVCGSTPTTQPPVTSGPVATSGPVGQCGRPQVAQSRVVGGKSANAHSWPWQIGLHRTGRFICGGSVVNSRWVVTAAHCVHRQSASQFTVKLGDHDRRRNEGEQTIQVKRVITHPGYGSLNNDIALLELAKPVMFGKHVQPVCLPKQGEKVAVGTKCYITGWGKMRHPGSSVNILQQLGLKIQSHSDCVRKNSKYARITDQMICTANPEVSANQSGCHGDSGGPFVCENGDGSWTLQGAVSWGSPRCDIKDAFTVFARVASFRNWIDQYIN